MEAMKGGLVGEKNGFNTYWKWRPEREAMLGRKSVLTLSVTENGGHVGEEISFNCC